MRSQHESGGGEDEEVCAFGSAMVSAVGYVLRRGGRSSFLEDGLLAICFTVCRFASGYLDRHYPELLEGAP